MPLDPHLDPFIDRAETRTCVCARAAMCELEMQLLSEVVNAPPLATVLPPANALRNRALALAGTTVRSWAVP